MEHILTAKGTMPKPKTVAGASIPEYIEVKATDGNTVAFLSPESDGVVAWIDDEQNGSCTIEIELPITGSTEEQASKILTTKGVTSEVTTLATGDKWQYLTDKYRIYADDKEFVILNPDAVDKQRDGKKLKGKIKAHESWVLLGKKFQTISNDPQNPNPPWGAVIIVSGGAAHGGFEAGSAGSALSYLLNGTGWTVGTVDVTGTYDLETEKESVLYNINQVQEKWGGILIWDSVNKTVSLRDEATYQPYTGYQIRYAKNLKGINRVDDYDIVTRLYPFGENDLNISAVNGGLLYLDNHSYSDDILEGVWYNQDLADQSQLKTQGEKQLAVMCRPRHNYKTEVLDLRSLPGYGHETFARSDMVDLFDEEFGANARVRIIRYRHNVFQPWLCDMELGDPIEKIQATVAQTVLMAKFYKNVVAPNTSFQNLLKAIINTEATEINGASGDYTLIDGVSTWKDPDTGDLTRATPKGLIISSDGGQTWKTAISGKGIHADAGWVGKLNAGVVTIGAETTFAEGYDPVDNHLYFQYSVDGTSWHETFNSATDKYMRQKVGDDGTWSEPARIVAVDGQDGTSSYLWVRYSQNANGNPMTTDPANAKYIGVATTNVPSAPTSYASYSWSLIKGTDGVPGEKGANGLTSYLHIKYSNDGVTFTGNGGEDVGAYIGTYVDFTQADSTNFNDYTWNKVRGEDGYTPIKGTDYFDGVDGQDGSSSYLWVRYSQNANGNPMTTDPTGAVYIGVATTATPTAPTSYTAYQWSLIKGQDGVPGETGADGKTSYLHIKYSDDGVNFTGNGGEDVGAYIGTYVDFNSADSATFSDYTWNKVKGEDGQDGYTPVKGVDYFDGVDGQNGADGTSSYLWIRYSQQPNGNPMTTDPTGAKYIGVATTTTASAPSSYASYSWSLIKGTDGIPGEKGDDGQTSYLHIKYSDDGVNFTANNGEDVGAWIGTYVDFNQEDSTNFGDYTWNKVKGEDGQDVRKFTSQPVPPYDVGDLWIKSNGDTMVCVVARETGLYEATDWRDIAQNKFNAPGYVTSTNEGIKVFDASEDLRVLLGSWLVDAVRKYGLKVIDGEIYSSLIRSGAEDATSYIQLSPGFEPLTVKENDKTALNIWASNGGLLQIYDTTIGSTGDMAGQIVPMNDAMGQGLKIHARNNQGYGKVLGLQGSAIECAGDFDMYSGTKYNIEQTENYGQRGLAVRESPEQKYVDEGIGTLIDGQCQINVDPIFMECIEPNTPDSKWHVHLTPYADVDLYVAVISDDCFVVKEKNGGTSTGAEFTWSLSATRKNYAGIRLMEVIR